MVWAVPAPARCLDRRWRPTRDRSRSRRLLPPAPSPLRSLPCLLHSANCTHNDPHLVDWSAYIIRAIPSRAFSSHGVSPSGVAVLVVFPASLGGAHHAFVPERARDCRCGGIAARPAPAVFTPPAPHRRPCP